MAARWCGSDSSSTKVHHDAQRESVGGCGCPVPGRDGCCRRREVDSRCRAVRGDQEGSDGLQVHRRADWDAHGNVYFSDIPNEKIHKIGAEGKLSIFRDKSNSANGLMINAKGEIVACEMTGAIVAISADGKDRRVITDKYDGKRYNAPNDLVLDKAGGVYFTDLEFPSATFAHVAGEATPHPLSDTM
jgi:sugar lactone lactonase YvrE